MLTLMLTLTMSNIETYVGLGSRYYKSALRPAFLPGRISMEPHKRSRETSRPYFNSIPWKYATPPQLHFYRAAPSPVVPRGCDGQLAHRVAVHLHHLAWRATVHVSLSTHLLLVSAVTATPIPFFTFLGSSQWC
jgi:hypothetical protein